MEIKDPVNGMTMTVKSVYYPALTLLQGAKYSRDNYVLNNYLEQNDVHKEAFSVGTRWQRGGQRNAGSVA
jgi:hypothetical protein